jgi:Family of unknown function (DUF6065)
MRLRRRPVVEFVCRPEDLGVIAEPVRAMTVLPAWFKQLPGIDKERVSATNDGLTVKRCMPFLDAMTTGWILPLAATVRIEITDGGTTVTGGWKFDREMVSPHGPGQVAGYPYAPRPPMKFHNYWSIRTAKGWSCLFLPPVNRPDPVVQVLAGVVDTDTYWAPVNFPFVALAADGVYTLEKGMPLVQVIPFRRVDAAINGSVRPETPTEREERIRIARRIDAGAGWYRRHARAARHEPTPAGAR